MKREVEIGNRIAGNRNRRVTAVTEKRLLQSTRNRVVSFTGCVNFSDPAQSSS
jgi:hypothetical protein